ncbi:fumarylacetoacetate hydrolase family protein [Paracoccus sp. DMF-8]|uniref:fumarylacetoacetate hydrolase family protein n=1 Tax=Paracoccus sp. DMF-8 TaxID=3019445 RepID=UPI0023E8B3AE|nr:fumarylacetoacetate hydrolase family protein [Paracoccus sp. DMF-8]MDF3605738.1 fumarylacetoacetate hydrolase family protein [Paracoccus sp. DMF-8]
MTDRVFPALQTPDLPVLGQTAVFPVRRIFCVGRNYVDHAREMGSEVDREAPFYFTKSAFALARSGQVLPYPPGTENYHHEVELVIAIGAPAFRIAAAQAMSVIHGYAVGLDMTRRDLQSALKDQQRPWDLAKDVENSAVIGTITPAAGFTPAGQAIRLGVNGVIRQDGQVSDMVWRTADLICHLSGYYHLQPGDLIMTGTPAGVGPVSPGDDILAEIDGLEPVTLSIGAAE